MASTAPQNASPQASPTSVQLSNQEKFWEASKAIQPYITLAGYWEALQKNCDQWAIELSIAPFWTAVKQRQSMWSNEFQRKTSGALLANPGIPDFAAKKAKRVREKLLLDWIHAGRPAEVTEFWPSTGPPVPLINDLVRTRIECQFLDGIEFFGVKLEELARELGIKYTRERKGRLAGYFAQHFCFTDKVIFRFGGGEQLASIQCEVQIATALATRIWEESHRTYEEWRVQRDDPEDWQWNPEDPRFTARQLGHMIHLADGLLVQLRNSAQRQS
jgi:hypothetical protein